MSDEIKALELEAQLDNQKYAQKKARIEILKISARVKELEATISSLDEAILVTEGELSAILEAKA